MSVHKELQSKIQKVSYFLDLKIRDRLFQIFEDWPNFMVWEEKMPKKHTKLAERREC